MTSTHQTDAAKAAAPPKKRRTGVSLIGFGIGLPLVVVGFNYLMTVNGGSAAIPTGLITAIGVALGVVLLMFAAAITPRDRQYNYQEFPGVLREWEHTWACQRCGTRFLA